MACVAVSLRTVNVTSDAPGDPGSIGRAGGVTGAAGSVSLGAPDGVLGVAGGSSPVGASVCPAPPDAPGVLSGGRGSGLPQPAAVHAATTNNKLPRYFI